MAILFANSDGAPILVSERAEDLLTQVAPDKALAYSAAISAVIALMKAGLSMRELIAHLPFAPQREMKR